MINQFVFTDLEKEFLQKALLSIKGQIASDIISGSLATNDRYISILKKWMWKELNLSDSTIQIVESYPNKYMKFHGVNPNTILSEAASSLDDLCLDTGKELDEGTETWVRAYRQIEGFTSQYPFEYRYSFHFLKRQIEITLPDGFSFKVKYKDGKSPVSMDSLANKFSDYLTSYLDQTMRQKNLEFKIRTLKQFLRLEDLGIEYELRTGDGFEITLILQREYTRPCALTVCVNGHDDPLTVFHEFVDKFNSFCKSYEESRQFLSELMVPLGFDLEFEPCYLETNYKYNYISVDGDIRVHVRRNDGYDFVYRENVHSLSFESVRKELRKNFLFALNINSKIRAYLESGLCGKSVSWEYKPGLYTSKLKLESFEKNIELHVVHEDSIESRFGGLVKIAERMSMMVPVVREHFEDLNVDYKLNLDNKYNIILTVSLPGFPKIVRTISPTMYRRDIIALSDQIFRKKKALHLL